MKKSDIAIVAVALIIMASAVFLTSKSEKTSAPIPSPAPAQKMAEQKPAVPAPAGIPAVINANLPIVSQAAVQSSVDKQEKTVTFPYYKKGAKGEVLNFTLSVMYKKGQPTSFKLIPDDCVTAFTVNAHPVYANNVFPAGHCNWKKGFAVDLQPLLQEGTNTINLTVVNKNGRTGLNFAPLARP